ncbi:MAG TPA: hypothetical protein VGB98_14685 [Pyrinomonadaceae bacterium]|jgi:hypothetical protein
MNIFKVRFLALCGLMVLASAVAAPFVANAQSCPTLSVNCGGKLRSCEGTVNGNKCDYDRSCLNCGGGEELLLE